MSMIISVTEGKTKPKERIPKGKDEKNIKKITKHTQLLLNLFVVHGDIIP